MNLDVSTMISLIVEGWNDLGSKCCPHHPSGQKGAPGGPPWGRPTPQVGRPRANGSWAPTFSNGYMNVVASHSLGACFRLPLNRGREGGVKLSCSLSHSHSLSQILAWVFIGFWLKFDFKKSLFLTSLLQEQAHIWRNNLRVKISFSFC